MDISRNETQNKRGTFTPNNGFSSPCDSPTKKKKKFLCWLWASQNLCWVTAWGHFVLPMGHLEPKKEWASLGGGWTMLGIKWVPSVGSQSSRAQLSTSIPLSGGIWQPSTSYISHSPSPPTAEGVWWARLLSQAKRERLFSPKLCNSVLYK